MFATGLGGGDEGVKLPVYPGMVSAFALLWRIAFTGIYRIRSKAKYSIRVAINGHWIMKGRKWSSSCRVLQVYTPPVLIS